MRKLKKIKSVAGYRIFQDFKWPRGLPGFSRFNLIYGWNGTGKSTIASLLESLSKGIPPSSCTIELQEDTGNLIREADFHGKPLNLSVFNQETVNRSILGSTSGTELNPIYYVGNESVTARERADQLRSQVTEAEKQLQLVREQSISANKSLNQYMVSSGVAIKNLLSRQGGGKFNNYDKAKFQDAVLTISQRNPVQLTEVEYAELLNASSANILAKIDSSPWIGDNDSKLLLDVNECLAERVTSAVIDKLKGSPEVAEWVGEGLELHRRENHSNRCLYCDNEVHPNRRNLLEAHFSDSVQKLSETIERLLSSIESSKAEPAIPRKNELYTHLAQKYEQYESAARAAFAERLSSLSRMSAALIQKRNNPFSPAASLMEQPEVANAMELARASYDSLLSVLADHNLYTEHFEPRRASAMDKIHDEEVRKAYPIWLEYSEANRRASEQVSSLESDLVNMRQEILQLQASLRTHVQPAIELSQELAQYLGRDELKVEATEDGYRITRNGLVAHSLSEGERTSIALLYFLKSLKNEGQDPSELIVVVDDPITSLDSNSIFSACLFLRQKTEECGQIFILTHNFTFFRLVKDWFGRIRPKDDYAAFMLRSSRKGGIRTAVIGCLDPLLRDFESEYHYLFKRVYDIAQIQDVDNFEDFYGTPNIARRLLETFLAFRVPMASPRLFDQMKTAADNISLVFSDAQLNQILKFVHMNSHLDRIPDEHLDLTYLVEAPTIMLELLRFIFHCDQNHYKNVVALFGGAEPDQLAAR